MLQLPDFQAQLEGIHNSVHVWIGGTMEHWATSLIDPVVRQLTRCV